MPPTSTPPPGSEPISRPDWSPELLATALERAVVLARRDAGTRGAPPPPTSLRPVLGFTKKLPSKALRTVQRALETDPGFRDRVADGADEAALGRASWLFLTRPDGWEDELGRLASAAAEEQADTDALRAELSAQRRASSWPTASTGSATSWSWPDSTGSRRRPRSPVSGRRGWSARRRATSWSPGWPSSSRSGRARSSSSRRRRRPPRRGSTTSVPSRPGWTRCDSRCATWKRRSRSGTRSTTGSPRGRMSPPTRAAPRPHPTRRRRGRAPIRRRSPGRSPGAAEAAAVLGEALAAAATGLTPVQPAPPPDAATEPPARHVDPPARPSRRVPVRLRAGVHDGSHEGLRQLLDLEGLVAIVDGYNVTMEGWPALDRHGQRSSLVSALGGVQARVPAAIHVVFDGDADGRRPSGGGAVAGAGALLARRHRGRRRHPVDGRRAAHRHAGAGGQLRPQGRRGCPPAGRQLGALLGAARAAAAMTPSGRPDPALDVVGVGRDAPGSTTWGSATRRPSRTPVGCSRSARHGLVGRDAVHVPQPRPFHRSVPGAPGRPLPGGGCTGATPQRRRQRPPAPTVASPATPPRTTTRAA